MTQDNDQAAVPAVVNINNEGQAVELRAAFDIKPSSFNAGLDRRKKNRKALIEWIQDELVEGTDWGRIHVIKKDVCPDGRYCQNPYHFSKPSLWKPGAEKIVGMLGFRSHWPDLELAMANVQAGGELIVLRCLILDSNGSTMSEGIGSRRIGQDYDDVNKALKMAKKSSLIDAVLNCAGLSEIFTQDVEDMDPANIAPGAPDPMNPSEEPTAQVFPQRHQKPLSTHCPIGKEWKGQPWELVDVGFLEWIVMKIDDKPDLVARARKELESRSVETEDAGDRRRDAKINTGKKVSDYAREIAEATSLDQIIVIKEELPADYEPSLRGFIQTRETELGPQSTGA
jgi:hypothetical protein